MKNILNQPLLFFDGVCNLCNSSVQTIIKKDRHQKFKFASLQSDAAKEILLQFDNFNSDIDSIILINNNRIYYKSSALIRICKILGGKYNFLLIFWIVPKPMRDWMYDIVAKNRYRWFGKRKSCMLPNADLKERFL
ncbi:MAG: thiol-disulfide oxidoreductase DCC family protein [Urechidicola sp.]|nr:thiol-disulfide oxidoreductase DCC family protein [Urechidicola sp.]